MSSTDELIRQYEARLAAFEARLQKIEFGSGPALASLARRSGPRADGLRLGVDVGGTSPTCFYSMKAGKTYTAKVPSTPADSAVGVLNGIDKICREAGISPADISEVLHGTTVATNTADPFALGLVTTKGYKDTLQIARSFVPVGLAVG